MASIPNTFLVYNDFKLQIQNTDLLTLVGECCQVNTDLTEPCTQPTMEWSDLSQYAQNLLIQGEQEAIEEISSYIRGRYITQEVFAPTQIYNSGTTYFGNNHVYYNAPLYDTGTTYNIGDIFSYCGIIYSAETSIAGWVNPVSGATYITEQDALYYAALPVPAYSQYNAYNKGALVWYQDNIYQAVQNVFAITPATSQNLELRYGIPSAQNFLGFYAVDTGIQPNTLPTVNTNYWSLYNGVVAPGWFTGTTYYFSGVNPTQNTNYWIKGDNRNPQIVMYTIDVLLYHLHSRISPQNIPNLRTLRYDGGDSHFGNGGAIGWLKGVQQGKFNLNCPEIQPTQGVSIRWGGYPKNNNSF